MAYDWRQDRIEKLRSSVFDPERNLNETVDELIKKHCRLLDAYAQTSSEVEQALGQALGYPRYKDDQLNFPGATEEHGVCVGEHVPESIAMEAAKAIIDLRKQLESLKPKAAEPFPECSCSTVENPPYGCAVHGKLNAELMARIFKEAK
jgi:hypothetical protein